MIKNILSNRKRVRTVVSSIVIILALYGLLSTTYEFSKYFSYTTSEIGFINKHGTTYKFEDYKDLPKTEGPAFFIKPPVDKGGSYEVFIDEDIHDKHMLLFSMYTFCELMYISGLGISCYVLIKDNYKKKDKVTGKTINND